MSNTSPLRKKKKKKKRKKKKVVFARVGWTMRSKEQWHHLAPPIGAFVSCVLKRAWNVSLLWGSGCDLTTASVITCCDCQISAPEIRALRPALKHTHTHNGEGGSFWDSARGNAGFNTFNRTQKSAPPLLHREHEEPNAWQDNCEVILAARDAMRVGSLSCQRWPVHRQLNMLPS